VPEKRLVKFGFSHADNVLAFLRIHRIGTFYENFSIFLHVAVGYELLQYHVLYKTPSFLKSKMLNVIFEFLTERASKCVISQFECPLWTSYRVSYCFSRANNSAAWRRLSTDDDSIICR
jgi:hypothetical protein